MNRKEYEKAVLDLYFWLKEEVYNHQGYAATEAEIEERADHLYELVKERVKNHIETWRNK